ncbi:MAG: thioredoxin domain-containing protein [Gaiellaceae bacterium]
MRRELLAPVLAVIGGAIVLVIALVVANQLGGGHSSKPVGLSGIPQKGIELGSPTAKLTMVEFSDPQCPFCGDWARHVFPTLVQKYVRTGKLRMEYAGLAFLGTDSTSLLDLAQAAGLQNKLWNVVELEFERQGTENSGYATDAFLKGIVKAVPGLNADKALSAANTNAVVPMINAARTLAETKVGNQISTPTFLIGPTGSTRTETIVGDQPLSTFTKAIDAQLKK